MFFTDSERILGCCIWILSIFFSFSEPICMYTFTYLKKTLKSIAAHFPQIHTVDNYTFPYRLSCVHSRQLYISLSIIMCTQSTIIHFLIDYHVYTIRNRIRHNSILFLSFLPYFLVFYLMTILVNNKPNKIVEDS